MNKEKIILGLDIGVGSVGWGIVRVQEEEYLTEKEDGTQEIKHKIAEGEIIDAGVRLFQLPQDRQKKSLALIRGGARRVRKTTRRKAKRLKSLMHLCKKYHLINENFNRNEILKPKKGDNENNWDIWTIRKEALERKLTDIELFRVLYHIAKHRGFYFHTKAEEIQKEDSKSEAGKVKTGLSSIRKKLENGGWKTVGHMFYEEYRQTNPENRRKRNKENSYEHSIHRSLLQEEIEKIFEAQQSFGQEKAAKEFLEDYIEKILMHEEGIDDAKLQKMMSRCEFTGEICAPRESYTNERFMLLNRLNTLNIVDRNNKDKTAPIEKPKRDKIVELAYKNSVLTFSQIREVLDLKDKPNLQFNLCSYKENNPEYDKKIICKIKNGQPVFDDKHKISVVNIETGEVSVLDKQIKDIFKKRLADYQKANQLYVYYSDIRKHLNLDGNIRFANLKGYTKLLEEFKKEESSKKTKKLNGNAAYIKQFEDSTFVELKGFHKIRRAIEKYSNDGQWESLKEKPEQLDTIAEALVYHKSDETRTQYLKENGIKDEAIINAVLTINMKEVARHSKEAMKNLLEYMKDGDLFHEAKDKCGYGELELKKQKLLKPYHGFFENNPVVARVISQSRKLINAIIRKYNDTYPIDQIHIEVATELASGKNRKIQIAQGQKRYREAKELAKKRCLENGIDPEEGQNLLMFRLAEQQNYRCPYTDKAITLYPATGGHEVYILDCEIDHVLPMSRSFNDSLNNKVLCTQKANQDKKNRIPFEWFEEMYGKDSQQWHEFESRVKKMYAMPYGKRRNLIRRRWTDEDKEKFLSRDLNDTRYAARHIADYLRKYFDFSTSERDDIKDVSRIKVRSGNITAFLRYMWGLRKDREESDLHHAVDALVVACSTDGHVYLISNLAKEVERKGKNWYNQFGFVKGKFKPWDSVREDIQEAVEKIFVSRMPRHTVTGGAHEDTIVSKKTENNNRTLEVRGGYAKMGEVVRADVYVDKNGKNYMVPIYSVDIYSKKPLPDKYLRKNNAPYDEWPSTIRDSLKFKFSLFKDDLISLNGDKFYIDFIGGTRSNISVKNINGIIFASTKGKTKSISYRNAELRKYSVDFFGNYKEIKEEKRLGNRYELRKKRLEKS